MRLNYGEAIKFLWRALEYTEDRCLLWPYAAGKNHYPAMNKWRKPHRIVCEKENGPAPKGTEVAHTCGNKLCVARKHLRWDTHTGNLADKLRHNTHTRGTRHYNNVLSEADARHIKFSNCSGELLARKYGVSRSTVCSIRKGRWWAWLER